MIDLHIHSTCSDGTFTPKQIVQKVIAKGLYGFSLTDHDTVDGIPEILEMCIRDRCMPDTMTDLLYSCRLT